MQFYSLSQKTVVRTSVLTHWATSMDVAPQGHLLAFGCQGEWCSRLTLVAAVSYIITTYNLADLIPRSLLLSLFSLYSQTEAEECMASGSMYDG